MSNDVSTVSTSCTHIAQVNQNIEGKTRGCEECEKSGSLGTFTALPDLRTCWLLWFFCK